MALAERIWRELWRRRLLAVLHCGRLLIRCEVEFRMCLLIFVVAARERGDARERGERKWVSEAVQRCMGALTQRRAHPADASRFLLANGGHVRARSLMVKLREVHDPAILVLDPDGLHGFVLVHRM